MTIYNMRLKIEDLPKTTNASGSGKNNSHWARKRERDKWKRLVVFKTAGKRPPEPLCKAEITLTRHSARSPDYDGLVASFKHVIDGLVAARIIPDDSMEIIGKPDYRWEKAPPRGGFITVFVRGIIE